jgi:hypothetical protein
MHKIYSLLDKYVQSINECNLELAREIWDSEDSISFIHPLGYEHSFEKIKEHFYLGTMDKLFSKRDLKIKNISIKFFDKVAFLEFRWDFYATKKENDEQIHTLGRETQLLVLRNNEWKINNIHYSQEPVL